MAGDLNYRIDDINTETVFKNIVNGAKQGDFSELIAKDELKSTICKREVFQSISSIWFIDRLLTIIKKRLLPSLQLSNSTKKKRVFVSTSPNLAAFEVSTRPKQVIKHSVFPLIPIVSYGTLSLSTKMPFILPSNSMKNDDDE